MSLLVDLISRAEPVQTPAAVRDPVPRAAALTGLVAVAAIHFGQVVPTIEQTPYLGALFVGLTAACAILAARLIVGDGPVTWLAIGLVDLTAMLGFVFTRLFSTFLDNQDVGNWSEMLGLVALLLEGLLVLLSAHQVLGRNGSQARDQA
jgi:hypothetical protein